MEVRLGRVHLGLALMGALALGACGPDAESADDDSSTRVPPPVEAEPVGETPVPEETPTLDPAPQRPTAPAPAPEPAAPAPPPPERVIPVSTYPPEPEVERPMPATEAVRELRALEAGRTLEVSIESGLSTESARPGDVFHAIVKDDILGSAGEVLLPIGTRLKGRVAESRQSEASGEPAVLRLEFESVTVGQAVRPLKATVVEAEMQAEARDSNATTAAKVGAGAAAGALVGRVLGRDRESAVKGAVVGTVAGTAAAIATREGHATLAHGARLVIRLDERLIVDN
jgi:hypothetical protein